MAQRRVSVRAFRRRQPGAGSLRRLGQAATVGRRMLIGAEVRRGRECWLLQRSAQVGRGARERQRAFVVAVVAG